MDQIEKLREGGLQLVELVRRSVGGPPTEQTKWSTRDIIVATSSALERLATALKQLDPTLADQLIRSVYELLKNVKEAMITSPVHSALLERTEAAREASDECLRAAHALFMQSPRGPSATSPRQPSPRSPHLQPSPSPGPSLLSPAHPRSPRSPQPSPPVSPSPSPQVLSPRVAFANDRRPPQPLSLPLDLPLPGSPRASPLTSPSRQATTPLSPSQHRVRRPWEEEDRIICERAMEGVRKALRVFELLSSPDVRAHAREIAELTREGLSDLALIGNRAQAIGLELPSATLRASSAQMTQLIRQTLVAEYVPEEGNRIAKDLALSVRAIMFSSYFASSPLPSSESYSDLDAYSAEPMTNEFDEQRIDKGKEKLDDEFYDVDGYASGDDHHGMGDEPAIAHASRPEAAPASQMPDGKSLKESFRALDFLLERRKPRFYEEDAAQQPDDDFRGATADSNGKTRVRSLYVEKPLIDATKPQESSDASPQDNGVGDVTHTRRAPPSASQQQRLTINLGALPAQRLDGKQTGNNGLRSSNSMPERGRPGSNGLQPGPKSARAMASSPSSFKPPVTSASDERAVGGRLTVRKPVFLTGYLDATRFYIGGTISFRVIVNNMHKRPVKGVMMKLYKHTASFSFKHNKATGESERKVESRHKVKVATEQRTPAGFPVVQSKQWTGHVEFALPASLPPSIIADSAATYEIAYSAKLKLVPKSCTVELGPFELHES